MYIIYWTSKGQAHYHRYGQKDRADYFVNYLKKKPDCINVAVVKI